MTTDIDFLLNEQIIVRGAKGEDQNCHTLIARDWHSNYRHSSVRLSVYIVLAGGTCEGTRLRYGGAATWKILCRLAGLFSARL